MNPNTAVKIAAPPSDGFDIETETLIIGAGACGLVAALAAVEAGQRVLVVEADPLPAGSTSLSAGLVPAAGTLLQKAANIADSAEQFAADIQAKAHNENDPELVTTFASGASVVIDWLSDQHQLPFSLVHDFDYPGHTHRRMHGLPTRSGIELIDALRTSCERAGIDIICDRRAHTIYNVADVMHGVAVAHPVGQQSETIACQKLLLACNGFGGNRAMVSHYMPDIADALWFGHSGNLGDAVDWGNQLGAAVKHLGAYQGHGNVAHPQGILISWAVITEGGVQVNVHGMRFWDESQGYSEAARAVLSQPESIAIAVFDERIAGVVRQFEDFKQAEAVNAVVKADSLVALAEQFNLPVDRFIDTMNKIPLNGEDQFGRTFSGLHELTAPYYGVRVTGALFHTQGGLDVEPNGQVRKKQGGTFPNLFAGGGAACGVSGSADSGYLSGNGLLSAMVLGYTAGAAVIPSNIHWTNK